MRRRVQTASPKWEFTDAQVLVWAESVDGTTTRFFRTTSKWPQEKCDALHRFIQRLFSRSQENRGLLRKLALAVKNVATFRDEKEAERIAKVKRTAQSEKNRRALAEVAKAHPKGYLIGATQTIGYKSQGNKQLPLKRRQKR